MKLSIIIPVFNEEKTIQKVLAEIDKLTLPNMYKEVIIVDDASSDKTAEKIHLFLRKKKNYSFFQHKTNLGKGAAVRTGISNATGGYIVIQDADLEYNPQDIIRLVRELKNDTLVVYGTRLNRLPSLWTKDKRPDYFWIHFFGNRFLSLVTSILYGQWITDMETCYKLFPKQVAKEFNLKAKGFEFEPEITAKILKKGLKIKEIPITTKPRSYDEGKKLNTINDGAKAIWTLIKNKFLD